MSEQAHWQVQEAKQRFSEVLRAAEKEGPQTITRHGEDVAVIVDIAEYRKLIRPRRDFKEHLMTFPGIAPGPDGWDVFDEVEAQRKRDFGRPPVDLSE